MTKKSESKKKGLTKQASKKQAKLKKKFGGITKVPINNLGIYASSSR